MPLSSAPAAPQAQGSPPTVWQLHPLPPTRLLGPSPTSRTVPLPEGALLRDRNQDDSQMTPVCPRPLLRERDSFTEWESQEAHPVGRATAVPGSHHLHDTVRQLLTAARSPSGSIPVSPLLSSARGTFDHGSRKGRDARPGPQLPARSRQRWGQTRPPEGALCGAAGAPQTVRCRAKELRVAFARRSRLSVYRAPSHTFWRLR